MHSFHGLPGLLFQSEPAPDVMAGSCAHTYGVSRTVRNVLDQSGDPELRSADFPRIRPGPLEGDGYCSVPGVIRRTAKAAACLLRAARSWASPVHPAGPQTKRSRAKSLSLNPPRGALPRGERGSLESAANSCGEHRTETRLPRDDDVPRGECAALAGETGDGDEDIRGSRWKLKGHVDRTGRKRSPRR